LFIKLILVLLLGWIVFTLIKRFKPNTSSNSKGGHGQKMIACVICDTHVPESDVIVKNGKNYCSKEHAE
jgi:hypothetical protein